MFRLTGLYFIFFFALFVPAIAVGQDSNPSFFERDRNISVTERRHEGYEPLGIRSGALMIEPALRVQAIADDNIFATETLEESDVIGVVAPSVNIETTWSRHQLTTFADLERREYFDFGNESVTNYGVGTSGRLDVTRGTSLGARASYRKDHEARSDAGAASVSEDPVEYDATRFEVNGIREMGRTKLQAAATYAKLDYNDVTFNGGTADQDFRDHDQYGASVRADYAISPDTAVFARATYEEEQYDTQTPNAGVRDQSGYFLDVGADFDLTNLVRGEVSVGYLNRSFDGANVEDIDDIRYQGRLDWFVSPLVTVTANGSRTVRPSGLVESPAFTDTRVGLSADYELRRNIILSAGYDYGEENYRGIDRLDTRTSYYAGAAYKMNRSVALEATIERETLDSDGALNQPDFGKTRVLVGVTLRR